MVSKPFKRVLIANRGEIAVRIIRTLRDLNIESVAVYSDADSNSLHRNLADYAFRLEGDSSQETYLNVSKIIDAIKISKAQAVHPGYGFLSENSEFAQIVSDNKIKFIGPSAKAMQKMGNKIAAKQLMETQGLPVVPGSENAIKTVDELRSLTTKVGFPIILKAAAGGGGRGMRVVTKTEDLETAFQSCQREALAYFNDDAVFCERYIANPRHIEFQVLFDEHGNGVHLFERDCTIQRRHQKLFEEAPSAYLSSAMRQKLGALAVKAARAANYCSAGTIEFICDSPEQAYFMEMNTRIQVEHPVTEMITGIDLISQQIQIALGEKLSFRQDDIKLNGWAMEARINAESPLSNFLPAVGTVKYLHLPQGPFIRVDSHLYQGYSLPSHYDSMIAKIISWGPDREYAIKTLRRALSEFRLEGFPTTAVFHETLLAHEDFLKGRFTTNFIEQNYNQLSEMMQTPSQSNDETAILAGLLTQMSAYEYQDVKFEQYRWKQTARAEGCD